MEVPCRGITGTDVRGELESVAGGDDLAAQDGAVADRRAGELRRRLPVLVIVHPLLLQVSSEPLLLLVGPVPVRRQLPSTG